MELLRALGTLIDPPTAEHRRVGAAIGLGELPPADEYTDVIAFQAYPYASVYLGDNGMLGGEARDRVAGFWRTLGAEPTHEPDHIAALLTGVAQLADAERTAGSPRQAAVARTARHVLYWDHVASWMPAYLALLRRIDHPYYVAWAELVEAALVAEAEELGAPPARVHGLTVVPAQAPSTDDVLAAVLAPSRIGMTLARDDLVRAGDDLGLGCRAGERRFVLRALFAQDARGVVAWLADEARRQAAALEASPLVLAKWWRARARAGATWLDERTRDVGDVGGAACAAR